MALRCSHPSSNCIRIPKHSPLKKPSRNRVMMLAQPQSSVTIQINNNNNNTPFLQIKPSFKNKVFEDPSEGIVCYRDDSGEITCEGCDEGPRLQRQHLTTTTRLSCNTGDAKMIDVLQRSWLLQVVDQEDVAAYKISNPLDYSTTYYAAN